MYYFFLGGIFTERCEALMIAKSLITWRNSKGTFLEFYSCSNIISSALLKITIKFHSNDYSRVKPNEQIKYLKEDKYFIF